MGQLKNSRKAVLKEIDREWEGEECKPGCCEWKINVASVNQDVSTNVKQAAGIHSQQLLCSWDFPSMRQVPDLNIASTIQYDGGSTWALFHFIQFSSIVIFIYYMFSLSILHVPFFSVWASSTSAGRHFASTHNGAFLFVVRIRFRFVNAMELNEMYNLLYLGDFGSQCAMRKTKPKSHFRFLFLCNIYSNICKLIHMYIYTYVRVYCWV